MSLPKRKSTRLKNCDYNTAGFYFITICTKDKKNLLCTIEDSVTDIVGGGAFDAPNIELSYIGNVVERYILSTNNIKNVSVDKYVIMPNHIHLIVVVEDDGGTSRAPSPTNSIIPHLVSTMKRFVNRDVGYNIFQRSFHDHIIRGEKDYLKIWEYIDTNPAKWQEDCFYNE